jgi:hypothetical protein
MEQAEIALRRLASQRIARPLGDDPAEVVRWMGAIQAQDYLGALWAVGARTTGASEQAVAEALATGRIVRTWPMRGTIHLVAPEDVRWMLALLTPRVVQRTQGRLRQLGLDGATLTASERVLTAALEGGRQLTRHALFAVLEDAGISTAGQRGIHILGQLAQAGVLCFGAHAGKQPTFTLLDEWVPAARPLSRDEALAALTVRYFTSHGPATVHDFCWWSGLTVADARAGLATVSEQLTVAQVAGQSYYYDAGATLPEEQGRPFLLPPFDEFLIAYRDRDASLDPAFSGRVNPGANGIFQPIVVVDGRVIGTWRRTRKTRRIELAVSPFEPWTPGLPTGLAPAAETYGRFLGLHVELSVEGHLSDQQPEPSDQTTALSETR